jgi:undecaprenyl-diphosphatase
MKYRIMPHIIIIQEAFIMDILDAIIMGLVQGLAEFLPISSSGHLAIMKHVLHMNTDTGLLFDVLLHLGTLAAIFIAFWKDIRELFLEGCGIIADCLVNAVRFIMNKCTGKERAYKKVLSSAYRRFVLLIIVSTIPTAIIGVIFKDMFESAAVGLLIPGICLILTSVLLTVSDFIKPGKKAEKEATFKDAGLIGLAQGIAILPGLSRSGTTITACLARGYDRAFAVKYSFIMSIPAVLGAAILELKDFSMDMVNKSELLNYAIGTVVAGVVGFICIKTMLVLIRGKKFKYFAEYCFVIGVLAIVSHFLR